MMSRAEESYGASTDDQFRVITHPFTKCRDPKVFDGSVKFSRGYQVRNNDIITIPAGTIMSGVDFILAPSIQCPVAYRESGTTWTTAKSFEGIMPNFLPDLSGNNALQYLVRPIPSGDFNNPTSFSMVQATAGETYKKWRLVSMAMRIRVLSDKDAKGDGVAAAKFLTRGNNVTKYSLLNGGWPATWAAIGTGQQYPRDLGFLVHDFDPYPVSNDGLFPDASDVRYFKQSELADYEFFLRPSCNMRTHGNDWVEFPNVISCVGYRDPTGYGIPLVNSWFGNAEKYLFDSSFDSLIVRIPLDAFTRTRDLKIMVDVVANYEFRLHAPNFAYVDGKPFMSYVGTMTNSSNVNAGEYCSELYRRLMYMFPGRKIS